MFDWWWLIALAVTVAFVVMVVIWRPLRNWGGEVQIERARELFLLQRERLQSMFLPAAASTGKPRGLRWTACMFENDIAFARDRHSRQLVALVLVAIQFEAVEGSDMEGLPAVGNLRYASAVFYFHAGQWATAGRAIFNLNPTEALQHFHNQYEQVGVSGKAS